MKTPEISVIVPLYNEETVFNALTERLMHLISNSHFNIEIILIDDGSHDKTPELMKDFALTNAAFQCVFLSRNFGHQIALTAGLQYARAKEAVMVIDGDLQDPPELLNEFYNKYKEGYDVVYAVRKTRQENRVKKTLYKSFYRLQKKMVNNIDIKVDSGDFCLMSRRVVNYINSMKEESRFIRGMRAWVGFKQTGIEYNRDSRSAGATKYSLQALMKLASNGIYNFTEIPVKYIMRLGLLAIILSLAYLVYNIVLRFSTQPVPIGFTGLLAAITLFGGVQLVSLGIIGEYVLRIFFQVKNRPLYIIDKTIFDTKEQIHHEPNH